jgi:hypothetical protein
MKRIDNIKQIKFIFILFRIEVNGSGVAGINV